MNDVLSWIALALALAANSSSSGREVAKLAARRGRARARARRARRPGRPPAAPARRGAPAVVARDPRRRRGPRRRGVRDERDRPALRLRRVRVRRPLRAAVARSAREVADPRRDAGSAPLLLPLYLVLPGATTNFRDLDLGNGGEILVVLVVAAASKLLAGGVSARGDGPVAPRRALGRRAPEHARPRRARRARHRPLGGPARLEPLRRARDHGRRDHDRHEPEPARCSGSAGCRSRSAILGARGDRDRRRPPAAPAVGDRARALDAAAVPHARSTRSRTARTRRRSRSSTASSSRRCCT